MEGDNKYDPTQALYTRRIRQLKDKNNNLRITQKDLTQLTTTLQESFYSLGTAAKILKELNKNEEESFTIQKERMMKPLNTIHN